VPITPFHFGPGALVTMVSRGFVSFLAFCASNVLIDVESLYHMLTRAPRIHTFLHTYVGATLAAALVVAAFYLVRWLTRNLQPSPGTSWRQLSVGALIAGALLGAWSHVLLDSIMHADMTPLAPFSDENALHGAISLRALHLSCVIAGAIGLAWWSMQRELDN